MTKVKIGQDSKFHSFDLKANIAVVRCKRLLILWGCVRVTRLLHDEIPGV